MIFPITLIIVLFVLWIFFCKLGLQKMILHPGTYFLILWAVSIASEWILSCIGVAIIIDSYYIDELNCYAAYTAICFLLCLLLDKKNTVGKIKTFKLFGSYNQFVFFTIVSFAGLLIRFISIGASFNMGANRANIFEYDAASSGNFIGSLFIYFNFILQIYSGFLYASKKFNLRNIDLKYWIILLPLIEGVFEGVMIGGRNPVIITLKYFIVGIGFAFIGFELPKRKLKKLFCSLAVFFLCFVVFSTIVGNQRAETFGQDNKIEELNNPILNFTYGINKYMSDHYWGYQLRRMDYVDENNLLYGAASFYGALDIKIPFSSRFGIKDNLNLWSIFTTYTPKELYFDLKYEGYYTTNTIYLSLMKDFGPYGMLFVIFIMVLITHKSYSFILDNSSKKLTSIFIYILLFTYWSSSNFDSIMSRNIYMMFLIPLFLYDFFKNKFSYQYSQLKQDEKKHRYNS